MLNKKFILKLFEGFSIQRWNDLVRPFELVEMDKAAERMIVAYIIGKYEEKAGNKIDWEWIINASLFELLKKIALCDIKSPVQQMIRRQFPQEYLKLNEWVLKQYKDIIEDEAFYSDFTLYIARTAGNFPMPKELELSARVLRAAHKFASMRELQMIECVNEEERIVKIKKDLNQEIQKYLDLRGMQLLVTRQRPFDFIMMIEQLRFQTRWNQTPRVPKTSVLGHCYFVAALTVLLMRDTKVKMCPKRLFNDFFSALFHDLPEAVTRDIISPVKQATDALPDIVKKIEDEIVNCELVPLMDDFYADEIIYFTNDEFSNRIQQKQKNGNTKVQKVEWEDLNGKYNSDEFNPVDGKTVRLADHLSALIEADRSIKYGITSAHLRSGRKHTLNGYAKGLVINGIEIRKIFDDVVSD
ncbi:HD domain-containing protein [uncultured Treponema sp.]|uniref:HD domain-containing protein n=1 Tax=uncultured Treponema sp. TaxID=162155 RepID=UPI00280B40B2|nr:HD domain-containing protein [uncultured Treponema sp.]